MKELRINPTQYQIEANVVESDFEAGVATVEIDLNASETDSTSTMGTIDSGEATKIGNWFLSLARELK